MQTPTPKPISEKLTPMMRQYLEIKESHQDAILFFRLGDFYEMFFEDAVEASQILDIALTSRNKNQESSVPLCGIPFHSASQYIRKLVEAGRKVAICEQVEDPKAAKGIVRREVIRVVTPGLLVEEESLQASEPNYLAAFLAEGSGYHLALVDLATGEILLGFYEEEEALFHEVLKYGVREILQLKPEQKQSLTKLQKQIPTLLISLWENQRSFFLSQETFSEGLIDSLNNLNAPAAQDLLKTILSYVFQTQKANLKHLSAVQVIRQQQFLSLDERTFRHLELLKNLNGSGRRGTLFWVLNQTQTAMGARRLAKWIRHPLLEKERIEERFDALQELMDHPDTLSLLQEHLRGIQDIERMLGKLSLSSVNARDLRNLGASLKQAQVLLSEMKPKLSMQLFCHLLQSYPNLLELAALLLKNLKEELPLTLREGGMIASGIHPELDELRSLSRDGKSYIARLEAQERQRTKISSLKVRYNKVFGYYIEVTHTHRDAVPEHYIRKQTLSNAERYITPELKEYEQKVLGAEERIKNLEYQLFCELRDQAAAQVVAISQAASILSTLDVLASLAQVARENRYCRPKLSEEKVLLLQEGRHPVLERMPLTDRFIPNDMEMNGEKQRLFLITGPNMAGKSTLMRQAALAILMAQMGSFVAASEATIGLTDQLFTRIGASDDLSQGQSTFMVEMLEAAHILKSATERSFVVLDELGRGTSTYDGMSIAWAVAEYVAKEIQCRALFATHYHELVDLGNTVPGIVNFQVAVKEWNEQILFLRKLIPGGASRSYGIEVARLAGLPQTLLTRAKEVLHQLENMEESALSPLNPHEKEDRSQMDLFKPQGMSPVQQEILNKLSEIKPETLTPLQALEFLFELRDKIK